MVHSFSNTRMDGSGDILVPPAPARAALAGLCWTTTPAQLTSASTMASCSNGIVMARSGDQTISRVLVRHAPAGCDWTIIRALLPLMVRFTKTTMMAESGNQRVRLVQAMHALVGGCLITIHVPSSVWPRIATIIGSINYMHRNYSNYTTTGPFGSPRVNHVEVIAARVGSDWIITAAQK